MILHDVNSNLSWVEALKDNTDGKLILVRARAMERMQKGGIVPKHQILDNQKLAAYEEAIRASGMTFERVLPDNHCCNMAEKPSKLSRITSSASSAGEPPLFPSTSGANFSLRWNSNSSSFVSHGFIPICQPMHTYTATMTTTGIRSSQSAWRHSSTTNLTSAATTPNTAKNVCARHISKPLLILEILVNSDAR
jgi:hypothetical protein